MKRGWTFEFSETGGYDCITPGVDVKDVAGKRLFVIDAKDHGWYDNSDAPKGEREAAAIQRIITLAEVICNKVQ